MLKVAARHADRSHGDQGERPGGRLV